MYKLRKDIIVLFGTILSIIGIILPFANVLGISFRYLISFIGIVNLIVCILTYFFFKNKSRTLSLICFLILTLLFIRNIVLAFINNYEFKTGIYLYIFGYIFILYGFRKLIIRFIKKCLSF